MVKGSEGTESARSSRSLMETVARQAIDSCDAGAAVARALVVRKGTLLLSGRPLRAAGAGRLLLLACGKAAVPMYSAFVERLGAAAFRRPIRALIVAPHGERPEKKPAPAAAEKALPGPRVQLRVMAGEHPIPGPGSFRAGQAALRLMSGARPGDDVVVLVSGGGSALMAAPLAPFVTAADKRRMHQLLWVSGAPISAINTVRRHLSAVKGGRLAVAARRATSLTTLVVCDVSPDRYDEVASGPSLADRTTVDDMVAVVAQYGLAPALPWKVLEALRAGRLPETPKPKLALFRKARAQMLLSNLDLRNAAVRAGLTRGLAAEAMPTEIAGPVEEAVELVARAIEGAPGGLRLLVLGGETRTVPLAPGTGGRAQEFALRLALRMRGLSVRGWAFLACGSDGRDGNSPAAGAYADATTLDRARALKLDPEKILARADSFRFFNRLGDAVTTGPTRTTVRDLYLLLTGLARPDETAR